MNRTRLDKLVDVAIDTICELQGYNPANSQQTRAMRAEGIPAGDRDLGNADLARWLKRNIVTVVAEATGTTDADGVDELGAVIGRRLVEAGFSVKKVAAEATDES